MSKIALFITLKALPGKRDEVRRVWEKHLQANIAGADAHEAYYYCYDDADPDTIRVFQLYSDRSGPEQFVKAAWFPAYEADAAPLLASSQIDTVTPLFIIGAAR